jgi:hypothetical protein
MPIIVDYTTGIPTVPLDDLADRVRSEVRLCPYDLVFQKAIDTLREFCRFTRAWQYYPMVQLTEVGKATYDVTLPNPDCECIQVEWLSVDGQPSYPKTVRDFDQRTPSWRSSDADDFRVFVQEISRQFTFPSRPLTAGKEIKYRISLQPALDATRCGEDIMTEWEEVIAEGVKGKLFSLSQRPWTDLKSAGECNNRYYVGKQKARQQAWRQFAVNEENFQGKYKFAGR